MMGALLMKVNVIENDRLLIRPVVNDDKESFMRIQIENSDLAAAYKDEQFRNYFWETTLNGDDDIYMMIFMKEDGIHVGNCSFQKLNSDSIEIGMDIDKRFQNQGIGTATLILLAEYLRENAPGKRHTIRTKSNNIPCQRMIVKAGGVKVDEGKTSFDSTMEGLIHSLEAHGLPEEAEKSKTVLDSAKGVCAFIYKNAR